MIRERGRGGGGMDGEGESQAGSRDVFSSRLVAARKTGYLDKTASVLLCSG